VFKRLIKLQKFKIEIAEFQEDDDYSMDIEALKQDATIILDELTEKISKISSYNSTLKRIADSDTNIALN